MHHYVNTTKLRLDFIYLCTALSHIFFHSIYKLFLSPVHTRKLEDDIVSETSGHLKRMLVSMVQANRPSGNTVNRTKARKDAKDLYESGEKKWGTDESRFNVIICSRCVSMYSDILISLVKDICPCLCPSPY